MTGTTTLNAKIWCAVAAGARSTEEEIAAQLPTLNVARVRQSLCSMVECDSITRFDDGRYGVTEDCRFPRGLTVRAALKALGVTA